MLNIFISYSHKDEALKEQLETHLTLLKRQGLIDTWNDRKIVPGHNWEEEVFNSFDKASIVLILITADFISSDYCYDKELMKAVSDHRSGKKVLIPIILRECDWSGTPFETIQGLPTDMKPVVSRHWHTTDEAFLNICKGLKRQIEILKTKQLINNVIEIASEFEFISIKNTKYKFKGEIKNNKPNGFGRATFENGDEYIGNWNDGMIDGKGYYTWIDGVVYYGEWKEHKKNGFGISYNPEINKFSYGKYKEDKLIEDFNMITEQCAFCGGTRKNRRILIAGNSAMICEKCVQTGVDIIARETY